MMLEIRSPDWFFDRRVNLRVVDGVPKSMGHKSYIEGNLNIPSHTEASLPAAL